jgi:hypothetical protein
LRYPARAVNFNRYAGVRALNGLWVGGSGVKAAAAILGALALATISAFPAAGATPTWTVVKDGAKPAAAELTGIDCATPTHCFAVGYRQTDDDYTAVIEQGNAKTWTKMAFKNPASTRANDFPPLADIECAGPKSCFAVGTYYDTSDEPTALIQHWNGSVWGIMKAASPLIATTPYEKPSLQTSLNSVTCPTAKSCYAVGYYLGLNGVIKTLVEHWTGTTWAVQTAPSSSALTTVLMSVACVTNTNCFAVGTSMSATHTKPFILKGNGTKWSTVASPGLAYAGLDDIACASAKVCFALGSVASKTTSTLLQRWNGKKWSIVTLKDMPATNHLYGIACPSATTCVAVGRRTWTTAGVQPMVLRWDGTTWSTDDPPNQPGAVSNYLNAVTCSRETACRAVGAFLANQKYHSFVEYYQ